MRYNLNEELKSLEKQKMPANTKLLPIMNVVMKVFQCKSDENVNVTKYETPGYQGEMLSTLVIEPKTVERTLPCLVFFHGGGFMLKASGAHFQIAKEYAAKVPCKVVYVDYRLAPKHPFPIPVEDCFLTYQWVLEHAEKLKIDGSKIIIAGDSAGGNLASAVTLMARDRGLHMPIGAMLIYPVTDRRMITESMKNGTDTPVWDANLTKMMWDAYLGEQLPEHIEYASPVEAASLEGFPTTYIEVAEYDSLRDEGVLFCDKLRDAGIRAELHEIMAACHGFETMIESSITRDCMERRIAWLQNLLNVK